MVCSLHHKVHKIRSNHQLLMTQIYLLGKVCVMEWLLSLWLLQARSKDQPISVDHKKKELTSIFFPKSSTQVHKVIDYINI